VVLVVVAGVVTLTGTVAGAVAVGATMVVLVVGADVVLVADSR
jgi:hypothetical protein